MDYLKGWALHTANLCAPLPSVSIFLGSTPSVVAMAGSTNTSLAHAVGTTKYDMKREDVKVLGSSTKLNATERRDEPRT